MATNVSLNGTTYAVPATAEDNWGDEVSNYLIALGSGVLQKAGGAFTLTAEIDFGATYGIKSAYFKSRGTVASTGILRLANAETIEWRNNANSGDLALNVTSGDVLAFDGVKVPTISSTDTLTNKSIDADTNTITNIENADIKAGAAIDAAKIHNGSVSNTEFGYLTGVTSALQTQLDAKASASALTTLDNAAAKTADAETITGIWTFDEELIAKHNATPSNPSAGYNKLYFKNDDNLYKLDSAGNEVQVNSSGTSGNFDINQISSTNYTITDSDGYRHIHVTTGASDRTITLPTAADNTDRLISVKKIDSGAGNVIIDGEGAETIEGVATYTLTERYSPVTLVCDGTEWFIVSSAVVGGYEETSVTLDNGVTGTAKFVRVGNLVTVTGTSAWTHSSATGFTTTTGLIPASFRPTSDIYNTYISLDGSLAGTYRIQINSNGSIGGNYYDASFTLVNRSGTATGPSLSYVIT